MTKLSTYTAKIPDANGHIHYTDDENAVWRDLMAEQLPNVLRYTAQPYLRGLDKLALPLAQVPQTRALSEILQPMTGWRVEPVPALIGFSKFFDMLANRTFPAASFIRSRADFDYIKEPDIFHEIFGHTPLLTDDRFANFSAAIGQAGQKADRSEYSWLIRLYWFTIEFGLTVEHDEIKALGSGLASSRTELPHAIENAAVRRRPFDVLDILRTPYRIDIHQPVYFVIEDLDSLFAAAERDLLQDVARAQALGLFAPTYPPLKPETRKAS